MNIRPWVVLLATGVLLLALGFVFLMLGLQDADRLASTIGALAGVAGLGMSGWAALSSRGAKHRESRQATSTSESASPSTTQQPAPPEQGGGATGPKYANIVQVGNVIAGAGDNITQIGTTDHDARDPGSPAGGPDLTPGGV